MKDSEVIAEVIIKTENKPKLQNRYIVETKPKDNKSHVFTLGKKK
jgi:hypothetical protein